MIRLTSPPAPHRARRLALRRLALALLVVAIGLGSGRALAATPGDPPAAAPRIDEDGIYAMTTTRGESGLHIVEYWSKGTTLRAHTTIAGRPFITLVSASRYTLLDPISRRGVSIPRGPRATEQDAGRRRLFGNEFESMRDQGAERIRTEESPMGPLEVYRLTDDSGRRTVWVTADQYQLPIRFQTFDRRTGNEASVEYRGWAPVPLSEAFFEVPSEGWVIDQVPTYDDWLKAPVTEAFKQAPIFFPLLLHGRP